MKKIAFPEYTFEDVLNSCAEGMMQKNVKRSFKDVIPSLLNLGLQYEQLNNNGTLFSCPKTEKVTSGKSVLDKKKLTNLYRLNLRNMDKPARKIYEKLLLSTDKKCPFCGDIGETKNLDHFLPLAHFPQFSVMPLNLLPACRDCNMGEKGDDFATREADQILHPYLDQDAFFDEQWVHARYVNEDDGAIEFFSLPPEGWGPVDKERVIKHFDDFDLALRYGLRAGTHLTELIGQRDAFYRRFEGRIPIEEIKLDFVAVMFTPVIKNAEFANQWKRVMYIALSTSEEFLIPE